MLEKFGWSKGSGLGKNEQGISENIRVQHKVVPTGILFINNDISISVSSCCLKFIIYFYS